MIKMYDKLWDIFSSNVMANQTKITPEWIDDEGAEFDAIISSIPLNRLCRAREQGFEERPTHRFITQDVVIHPVEFEDLPDNTVLYDGTKFKSWYRTSLVFGQGGTEWKEGAPRPKGLSPVFHDSKPIWTNCDCLRDQNVLPVGRRGKWSVSELAHNAFYDTMTLIGARYGR
jgi:hypothetical protein